MRGTENKLTKLCSMFTDDNYCGKGNKTGKEDHQGSGWDCNLEWLEVK